MPPTREEIDEIKMFGCTKAAIDTFIETSLCSPALAAISILSDAQEHIAKGDAETGRQKINIAKIIISEHCSGS